MSIVDKLLERLNLKYDDLTREEEATYHSMLESINKSKFTVDSIRDEISSMRESVEKELTKTTHNSKQDLFLKARLRNYVLLLAFLDTPEKAKRALERALSQ